MRFNHCRLVPQLSGSIAAVLILVDGNPVEDLAVMYGKPDCVWQAGKQV